MNGHYTLQLKNDGNYEGEGANQPGATGRIGDYPEIFNAARTSPMAAWTTSSATRPASGASTTGLGGLGDAGAVSALADRLGTTYS